MQKRARSCSPSFPLNNQSQQLKAIITTSLNIPEIALRLLTVTSTVTSTAVTTTTGTVANSSPLVNQLVDLIGKNNFHITPLEKGTIHEIKEIKRNREFTKYRNYYIYQLKSSQGLQVVLKGIESEVTSEEITEALQEKGFSAKSVFNILNKDEKPQLLFKVELEPETKTLRKYEIQTCYSYFCILESQ